MSLRQLPIPLDGSRDFSGNISGLSANSLSSSHIPSMANHLCRSVTLRTFNPQRRIRGFHVKSLRAAMPGL